jgi:hypothetical protein
MLMPLLDILPQPDMSLATMSPMIEMGAISDAEFEAAKSNLVAS